MQFIDSNLDPWQTPGGEDAPAAPFQPAPNLLLDLAQWRSLRADWPAGLAVGLKLQNDADVEDIAADLPRFALIALHFPKWVDGRAYSQAHLLRARYRFAGEVRATGDVVVDMLPLLQRSGFDAAALRGDQSVDAAKRALGFFPAYYQGDVLVTRPHFGRVAA
jgi:uncharacterized protein (DUF934 family)